MKTCDESSGFTQHRNVCRSCTRKQPQQAGWNANSGTPAGKELALPRNIFTPKGPEQHQRVMAQQKQYNTLQQPSLNSLDCPHLSHRAHSRRQPTPCWASLLARPQGPERTGKGQEQHTRCPSGEDEPRPAPGSMPQAGVLA